MKGTLKGRDLKSLCFDKTTRERLTNLFSEAYKGRYFSPGVMNSQIELVLSMLEGYAGSIPEFQRLQPEDQKRRREDAESLANHLDGVIEKLKRLDDVALGFLVGRGLKEVAEQGGEPIEFPSGIQATAEVYKWRKDNIEDLAAFALGARKAVKDLPKHALNTSGKDSPWYAVPMHLSIALGVERLFWENSLFFSVSDNGLAAECLRAVFRLGGLQIDRVDYWLRKARDHYDSMWSFNQRMQKRGEE